MNSHEKPETIAIDPDDYHAPHVGRTNDGRQFFLTTPFEPAGLTGEGCEFVALYLFDEAGKLTDADIESFGARATMDDGSRQAAYDKKLAGLGAYTLCRIEIEPFAVDRFGTNFGLIVREAEDEEDVIAVEAQPGNYMCFFEPWDSGEYDT